MFTLNYLKERHLETACERQVCLQLLILLVSHKGIHPQRQILNDYVVIYINISTILPQV